MTDQVSLLGAKAVESGWVRSGKQGKDGHHRLQARYESCYVHLLQVVKFLTQPGMASGPAADVEHEARLSPEVRKKGLQLILDVSDLS